MAMVPRPAALGCDLAAQHPSFLVSAYGQAGPSLMILQAILHPSSTVIFCLSGQRCSLQGAVNSL